MRFLGILVFGLLAAPGFAEPQENKPRTQEPEVRAGFAESPDGIPVHYQVRGEPNGNPVLVLIHGWSHDLRFWEPHSTTLASTHRVIAVDLAGFGKSGKERTEWTIAAFGGDVSAVVEAVAAEQVVLLGFSMGASVALEAALQIPDRVVGVIIIDALKDPAREMTEEQVQTGIERMREEYGSREWVRRVGFTPGTASSYIDRCMEMITPVPPERWWASLVESRRWTGPRALEVLERIEVPVAAIATDRAPVNTEIYVRFLSSFTVRTMPGVGHLGVLWQDTHAFDRHVRELLRSWFGP